VPNLADLIEAYIRQMLEQSMDDVIDIQRGDLARAFQCVPSQITYVLEKRFSVDRGYMVKSQRGGGGYIRVFKLPTGEDTELIRDALASIDGGVSQEKAFAIIHRLEKEGVLNQREAAMAQAAVHRETLPLQMTVRDILRGHLLRAMLTSLLVFSSENE